MKGLSTIVAAIILIALVVTAAGIVGSWITNFVTQTTNADTCAVTTTYTVTDAYYNSTSGEIRVKLKNTGKSDLFNFTVEADNGTLIASVGAYSPLASFRLGQGKSQYIMANINDTNMTNVDTVKVLAGSCTSYPPSPVRVVNI